MGSFQNRKLPWLSGLVALFSLIMMPTTANQATAATVSPVRTAPVVAQQESLQSHNNPADAMQVTVALPWNHADQLDAFLANMYNPHSPQYRQFLTPAQFAAQFGPTASTVGQVEQFLQSKGLQIVDVSSNHAFLKVSGTAAQVQAAFGSPQFQAAWQGSISGVIGLGNQTQWTAPGWQVHPLATASATPAALTPNVAAPAGGFTPSDIRTAYDINPLLNSGIDGTGQGVALVELDGYVKSNITQFDNYYGLSSPSPVNIYVDGYNGMAGQGEPEVESDIEWVNAIAPKAQVYVYEAPNTDQGLIDLYQKIATDDQAKSIVTTWGECEPNASLTVLNSLHTIFQQYAAQGQSVFAPSGDSGRYDCGGTTYAVDSPASDPYVTGVGGTTLTLGTTRTESAWSSSGGGLSAVYSEPDYQINAGVASPNGMRSVPDVAMAANGDSIYTMGGWTESMGTETGVPVWGAIAALSNQYAANQNKGLLG